jgi:hypothetical protein
MTGTRAYVKAVGGGRDRGARERARLGEHRTPRGTRTMAPPKKIPRIIQTSLLADLRPALEGWADPVAFGVGYDRAVYTAARRPSGTAQCVPSFERRCRFVALSTRTAEPLAAITA